jgi:hypothetical protein
MFHFNGRIYLQAFEPGAFQNLPARRVAPSRECVIKHQL